MLYSCLCVSLPTGIRLALSYEHVVSAGHEIVVLP